MDNVGPIRARAAILAVGALLGAAALYPTVLVRDAGRLPADAGIPANVAATSATAGVLRYRVELKPTGRNRASRGPILPGEPFKVHFTPRRSGYLYIVAPAGATNTPETFLTARADPVSGATSNFAPASADFAFPVKSGVWLWIDATPGPTSLTVIFSGAPLAAPTFLTGPSRRPLTADDREWLDAIRSQYRASVVETTASDGAAPAGIVLAPADRAPSDPIVFEIHISGGL